MLSYYDYGGALVVEMPFATPADAYKALNAARRRCRAAGRPLPRLPEVKPIPDDAACEAAS